MLQSRNSLRPAQLLLRRLLLKPGNPKPLKRRLLSRLLLRRRRLQRLLLRRPQPQPPRRKLPQPRHQLPRLKARQRRLLLSGFLASGILPKGAAAPVDRSRRERGYRLPLRHQSRIPAISSPFFRDGRQTRLLVISRALGESGLPRSWRIVPVFQNLCTLCHGDLHNRLASARFLCE